MPQVRTTYLVDWIWRRRPVLIKQDGKGVIMAAAWQHNDFKATTDQTEIIIAP